MLEGKAIVGETDMLQTMQQNALSLAANALDVFDVTDSTEIAHFIKKVIKTASIYKVILPENRFENLLFDTKLILFLIFAGF